MKNTFLTIGFLFLIHLGIAGSLKVTTYNIRYDNPADGVNQWSNRKTTLIDLIKTNDADILCIQEGLVNQITDLQIALPNYQYVGVGRDDGQRKGEYAAIFYKKEKFRLLKTSNFWLSASPEIAGSIGWDAACVRICTWAQLYSIQDSQSLYVFNTHMDHVGVQSRKNSASLLLKRISELFLLYRVEVIQKNLRRN
jgi:endonuclease/exonuclease/phosphatase family metal-dependent hydrolase